MASLRRPTTGREWNLWRSLGNLLDLERLGLLGGVRVLGAGVDLELLELGAAERVLRAACRGRPAR